MSPKKLRPIEKAWMKRRETNDQIRTGVTILDCTVRSLEKCSEGNFLYEYIKILNHQRKNAWKEKPVDNYIYQVRSATKGFHSLDDHLKYALTQTIHVSAHGGIYKDTGKTFLEAGNSAFNQELLWNIWSEWPQNERPKLIVLSACGAGRKDMIEAFADGGNGCRYCIAPVLPADWERAAMFSALFYTFLFYGEPHFPRPGKPLPPLKPFEPVAAFRKTIRRQPRLTGWWKMFDYGKEI